MCSAQPASKSDRELISMGTLARSPPPRGEAPLPLTPLQKLTTDMCKDEKTIKELIIGRRVGFYKVRGEIGYGTFSRVKMAFTL
ncbi:serine/threonine-protein kinase NIM1-like protein [Lates japonicus]|uniref:Serine/threonine-protein kinase NIM1-like protein n=1 Tax=Lates japonicus TaxID=270547 RepID=A0AAD3MMX1_LATJO|nr:serine/threonine-protein kinase NIM1-like protein [Lates japonicus]